MPFVSSRASVILTEKEVAKAEKIIRTPSESSVRVQRAGILLHSFRGETVSKIARTFSVCRQCVELTLDKFLEFGFESSLKDLPRSGRTRVITDEARLWVISLACQKPKTLGYPHELWTYALLVEYIRKECLVAGYPMLASLSKSTLSTILSDSNIRPHKVSYYLERRDPNFDEKMAEVLYVYEEVELIREFGEAELMETTAIISYDEKPGLQAIENVAPDLQPVPGIYPNIARDFEYKRHGTLSLLAGIDLLTGHVHGRVEDHHRSKEFIELLKDLDTFYAGKDKIKLILDNHSIHISKETRAYLSTVPNRFEFVFTPKHGSWLNIIECFFSKMSRSILRNIRVSSKEELKQRILRYFLDLNQDPKVFKWSYKMDEVR